MTIAKAKLYKTAQVVEPTDAFTASEWVAVEFIGQGSFGLNFRCTREGRVEVLSENALTGFGL